MAASLANSTDTEDSNHPHVEDMGEVSAPLLSCYDPYHEMTYYVRPVGKSPTTETTGIPSYHHTFSASLNYQDFSPSIECPGFNTWTSSQTFQDLVDQANSWLRQNPDVSVRSCETMCWWTNEPIRVGDTECMVCVQHPEPIPGSAHLAGHFSSLSSPAYCQHTIQPNALPDDTIYTTGLRLWLVPSKEKDPKQQLGFLDVYPEAEENLQYLVKRVNSQLETTGIPGQILSAETVFSPLSARLTPNTLIWRDSQCQRSNHIVFLRIFYIIAQPRKESIGVKDFCPEIANESYEPFSALVRNAGVWVNENTRYTVTNYKSLYVSRKNDCALECLDRCQHRSFSWDSEHYFQILRVFYIHRARPEPSDYVALNYVTITPVQLQPGPPTQVDFETLRQSMIRLQAWLKAAGADIFTAECLTTPIFPTMTCQSLPELTYLTPSLTSQAAMPRKSLMYIRVFILGQYKDPDPSQLPPLPYSLTMGLQIEMLRREQHLYNKRHRRKTRLRRIFIVLCFAILTLALSIILMDQVYHIFGPREQPNQKTVTSKNTAIGRAKKNQ